MPVGFSRSFWSPWHISVFCKDLPCFLPTPTPRSVLLHILRVLNTYSLGKPQQFYWVSQTPVLTEYIFNQQMTTVCCLVGAPSNLTLRNPGGIHQAAKLLLRRGMIYSRNYR